MYMPKGSSIYYLLFLENVYLIATLPAYMSKGWAKVADELKLAPVEEEEEPTPPKEYEKIMGGPTGIICDTCGVEYTFEKDFHPRGHGQLVPAHRCLGRGGGMMGMKKYIRTLQ